MTEGNLTMEDVRLLKRKTRIGDYIRFKTDDIQSDNTYVVKGIVTQKYTNIFILGNEKAYSWIDYLLGRQMLVIDEFERSTI